MQPVTDDEHLYTYNFNGKTSFPPICNFSHGLIQISETGMANESERKCSVMPLIQG